VDSQRQLHGRFTSALYLVSRSIHNLLIFAEMYKTAVYM